MADQSFLGFVTDFKLGFNFVEFGGPGGLGGANLPSKLGVAKRTTGWNVNFACRADGTPQIDQIKADFEIYNKPNNYLPSLSNTF